MKYLHLDLQYFAGEKTEKATPKKRQDARKKGQVAKSQDVNTAILLFFVFIILLVIGNTMKTTMMDMYEKAFTDYIFMEVTEEQVFEVMLDFGVEILIAIAPILLIAIVAGLASNFMQIGFLFTAEPLKMQLNRIDPIQGAKRIFSVRALVELVKSLLKIIVVGAITFTVIWINIDQIMMLVYKSVDSSLAFFGSITIQMGLAAAIALLIISVIDYAYQKFDFEKQNRMSKNDIKDEYKNIEGDPLIKSKIKEKQRQMAMQRMMSQVPEADVIITNPTHYAIALKYDENKADAPYVVAKGVDFVALKIKDIAKHHNIQMVENRPLARALYGKCEIGDVIDEEFFQAVAEILAYVYRIQKKIK